MHKATSDIAKLLMYDNPGWLDRALLCSRCILDRLKRIYIYIYIYIYKNTHTYAVALAQLITFNQQVFVFLISTEFLLQCDVKQQVSM